MRRDNINYLAVGVFVLMVGAAFLWVLYRMTGSGGPTDEYFANFDNVGGIKYGTVTYYKGYPVGQVESVTPQVMDTSTRYRVAFSVRQGWKIPAGSVAAIVLPGPLAPAVVDIREGKGPQMLEPGAELAGAEAADMFAALNQAAADFKQLSQDSKPLLQNLTALSAQFSQLTESDIKPLLVSIRQRVDDPVLFDELKAVVKKLNVSADALAQTLNAENRGHIASVLANADRGSAQLEQLLTRIEDSRQEMHTLFEQMNTIVNDNRDGVTKTIQDASVTMRELRGSVETVADNIDSIVHYLEGSGRNVQEFSREVRENPGVLLGGKPTQDPLPAGGDNKK
jgi:phospholipid/cholesterol/gamma-HCH transport system substrate-binding protein